MTRNLLISLLFAVAACSQQPPESSLTSATGAQPAEAAKPAPLPVIDTRSPDSVVKSYWALQDWFANNQTLLGIRLEVGDEFRNYLRSRIELGTGEFRAESEEEAKLDEVFAQGQKPPLLQRDILEVTNETETRAVVTAKILNVTPIPAEMKLSDYESDKRKYGTDVRYIVEKTPQGWRLAQAWSRNNVSISLDKDIEGKPQTGGWEKVWEVKPKADNSGPSEYHYSTTEP